MKNKIICVFCEKDIEKEKFREDYTLVAWRDDEDDPESMNKLAKPAHFKCFSRFIRLNQEII